MTLEEIKKEFDLVRLQKDNEYLRGEIESLQKKNMKARKVETFMFIAFCLSITLIAALLIVRPWCAA